MVFGLSQKISTEKKTYKGHAFFSRQENKLMTCHYCKVNIFLSYIGSTLMFHFVDMRHWHNVAFLVLAPSQTISVVVEPWIVIFLSKMIGITFLFCSHVRLRSYMELCILVPGISTQHGSGSSEQVSTETPLSANQPLVGPIWSCTASMLLFF